MNQHLRTVIDLHPTRVVIAIIVALTLGVACNQPERPTPTPIPTPTPFATATPTKGERVATEVRTVFEAQVAAIKATDWATAYTFCSPNFRQLRTAQRFTQDAASEFQRNGYTPEGFEARNVQVSVRSPDRVTVTFDAYQDGAFLRTSSLGQNYILANGRWWDDGTWCKLRVGA